MRLMELGLAGVCFSSVRALTVSATFIPGIFALSFGFARRDCEPVCFCCCVEGSRRKAGGGGRFSRLPIAEGWAAVEVLVMEDVRRIGGGGLLACIDARRANELRIVPVE